ncbi:MAG: hypothetical protein SV760_08905, partial [Halobacteria archaeon]|nr:hypothetical protein [Halobacteria archaeon]
MREALALLGLFALQFLPYFQRYEGLMVFSGVYVVLGVAVLAVRRNRLGDVFGQAVRHAGR